MKIALTVDYDPDMLDQDLRHLGGLYRHLSEHGQRSSTRIDDGVIRLDATEDDDRMSAVLTAIGFMQEIYDMEARAPRPKEPQKKNR